MLVSYALHCSEKSCSFEAHVLTCKNKYCSHYRRLQKIRTTKYERWGIRATNLRTAMYYSIEPPRYDTRLHTMYYHNILHARWGTRRPELRVFPRRDHVRIVPAYARNGRGCRLVEDVHGILLPRCTFKTKRYRRKTNITVQSRSTNQPIKQNVPCMPVMTEDVENVKP